MVGRTVSGPCARTVRSVAQPTRRRAARHDRCPGAALSVLVVDRLSLHFPTRRGIVQALDRVCLAIEPGEIVGLVGESGSGKSVLSYAISGLLDPGAHVIGGEIRWRGTPIGPIREDRTTRAAVVQIFQNPRASLNPIRTVGRQLSDVAGKDRVTLLL